MKTLAAVWVFLAAVTMCIEGIWFAANRAPLLPTIIMLLSAVALFVLGFMLTKNRHRQ